MTKIISSKLRCLFATTAFKSVDIYSVIQLSLTDDWWYIVRLVGYIVIFQLF